MITLLALTMASANAQTADISLTDKSVTPMSVDFEGTVSGSISGSWWTEPGMEGASWYVVAGFRHLTGSWMGGEPVGVSGMEGVTLPLSPGSSFSGSTFSGLVAPSITSGEPVGPAYAVWIQMVPATDLPSAIAVFKSTIAPATDTDRQKQLALMSVCQRADISVSGVRWLVRPDHPGDAIAGDITGSWWGDDFTAKWYAVLGFRDRNGNWVGGEPVAPASMAGVYVKFHPGQSFWRVGYGIVSPSTSGTYGLWVDMVPSTDLADAISAFKSQTSTTSSPRHHKVSDIPVGHVANTRLLGGSVTPTSIAPGVSISGSITGQWWTDESLGDAVWYEVAGFRDANGVWVGGDPVPISGMEGATLPLYPGQSFSDNTFSGLTAPDTPGPYYVYAQMVQAADVATAVSAFKSQIALFDDGFHRMVAEVTVVMPADISLTGKSLTPANVSPSGTVSGTISGSWWSDPNTSGASWYVVAGFRDPNGAALGDPVGIESMQGIALPQYPGQSFTDIGFGDLIAPTSGGTYAVWLEMTPAASLSDAILVFKSQIATVEGQYHKKVEEVTVTMPASTRGISLTSGIVTPTTVTAAHTVSGTISGSWWSDPDDASTWYVVAGFRDSSGLAAGLPVGVDGMQGVVLPASPGQSFTNNGFSGLQAPGPGYEGTYAVWIAMVRGTSLSYAKWAFTLHPRAAMFSDVVMISMKLGDVTVRPAADIVLTSKSLTPTNVTTGGTVSGTISGNWWSDMETTAASWYVLAGFRDTHGAAVGDPVGVDGMQGVVLPQNPGQSFTNRGFGGLTAPTSAKKHSVWVEMISATSLSEAISAFKSQSPTAEGPSHKKVGDVNTFPLADIVLTSKSVQSADVFPGWTIAGTISGSWWTSVGSEGTSWFAVAGLRDGNGAAVGDPVWIGGMQAVTLPLSPGRSFSENGFGDLIAPMPVGTYGVWVQMVSSADLAGAIAAFRSETPTADTQYHKKVAAVTVHETPGAWVNPCAGLGICQIGLLGLAVMLLTHTTRRQDLHAEHCRQHDQFVAWQKEVYGDDG